MLAQKWAVTRPHNVLKVPEPRHEAEISRAAAICVQARAVKRLLAHRLDGSDAAAARREWHDLVEGQHALWAGVSDPYKHTIRAFLVHFHSAILRHSSERFNFLNGSIGAANAAQYIMHICEHLLRWWAAQVS